MTRKKFTNADFVHIHNHTEYSRFDGLNRIFPRKRIDSKTEQEIDEDKLTSFPALARHMGFKSLGITDHGTIGGVIKFMQECKKPLTIKGKEVSPIKPLLGSELYLSKSRFSRSVDEQPDGRKGNRHILVIAKNWEGYQNLCRLSNDSFVEGFYSDPRIDLELLNKYHKGLILSSACLSSVINSNLYRGRYEAAKKTVSIFKDIFGKDFYLEAMYHGIDAEGMIIPDIIRLGKEMEVKVLATNDVHYSKKSQGKSQEILMAMSTSRCIKDEKRIHFPYDEFYLKSAQEMGSIFGTHPELLFNTLDIASKVDINDIEKHMGGMRLPKYELPDKFDDPYEYMCHLAYEGMKSLGWNNSKEHMDQLKIELQDVKIAKDSNDYDFATYFLIVRDYVAYCENKDILVGCGRGSGYASVLLRTLGICYGPDPIKYKLLWSRFLGFDNKHFITSKDFGII